MIDVELCKSLCLQIDPLECYAIHRVGVEGTSMTSSMISILGWVDVKLEIY